MREMPQMSDDLIFFGGVGVIPVVVSGIREWNNLSTRADGD